VLKHHQHGNVIGVRVCANFEGWENHALEGRLAIRMANEGTHDKWATSMKLTIAFVSHPKGDDSATAR
jgi:hypothetical protein